jgi:flagellar biosynthesis chaperone FliJ
METTQLDPRLQKLVDLGESGTDILHGELKNMMYECEKVQRIYQEGYMDALESAYALTYQLAFAISDRTKKNG